MIRLLFPGHQYNRDHGIFISNTILQLIYYIGEGHMIFKKVIKGGHRTFFRVFVHFSVNCFPSFSKNKVFQQISGIKIKCICFRIYLAFQQKYLIQIYSFCYSDPNVGGGSY